MSRQLMDKIYRKMQQAILPGRIQLVDDTGPVQRMQVHFMENDTQDGIPRLAEFGFASNPPAGSDVAVICVDGDRNNCVAIATGNQESRPNGLASGETMVYNSSGQSIYLKADGSVVIGGATILLINASTKVRMVTPLLEVTGDIIDNCATQTDTAATMRQIYNTHTHNGVQTGGGTTAVPNQEM